MNKFTRWLAAGAVMAVGLGMLAIMGAAEPGNWLAVGMTLVFAALIFGVVAYLRRSPEAMAYASTHRSLLRWIASAVAALPLVGMVAFIVVAPEAADRYQTATFVLTATGIMVAAVLWGLPETARSINEVDRDRPALIAKPRPGPDLLSTRDVIGAWRSVLDGVAVFAQVAVPWVLVVMAALLGSVWGANHLVRGQAVLAMGLLLLLLASILVGLYIVPATIILAWSRWIIRGERPEGIFALPGRAGFSLAWRLWLFLTILGTEDGYLSKFLQRVIGGHLGDTLSGAAYWLLLVLMIGLGSSAALRLPALAVGDNDFTSTRALLTGRRLWPALPVGLVLSLVPFVAAAWGVGLVIEALLPPPGHREGKLDLLLAPVVSLMFVVLLAGIASAAAFLAKAYEAAKAELS